MYRKKGAHKYMQRVTAKKSLELRRGDGSDTYKSDPTDDVFVTIRPEDANSFSGKT